MIKSADIPTITDTDGIDDFTEGKEIHMTLRKATGVEYDTLEEFREARKKLSFGAKFKLTWQGKTKVGKIVGTVLDIAEIALPGWAVKARHVIQSQTNPKGMDKPKYLSKTIWSAIIIAVTAVLQALGVDLAGNPELMTSIYEVIYGLAGAFGLYGLRDAIGKQITGK